MNRFSKNRKPLLGSLTIYGKDNQGRKIILPTNYKPILQRQSALSRIRKLISKDRHKQKTVPWTAYYANQITQEYMIRVLITLNQYRYRQGVFVKEIHSGAFN